MRLAATCSLAASATVLSLANDQIGMEVDLQRGCALSAAYAINGKANVINTHDYGRYVQVSYYSGPQGYEGCEFNNQPWSWNPIGAGDKFGNEAQVLSHQTTATQITCTIRPIQWACNNILCDCTVDLSYTLQGSAIRGRATLHNTRSDQTAYPPQDQELPAVYVNSFLSRLVGYTGAAPCTGDEVTEWNAGWDSTKAFPWVPGVLRVTEPVLAFIQDDGFGVGVVSPSADHFIAGFSGQKGPGSTSDPSTGYIAPVGTRAIAWNDTYTYEYAVILGNLGDIRSQACAMRFEEHLV